MFLIALIFPQVSQQVFRKQNIALANQNKSNSFTFIAKDKNNLLDIKSVDGEITNQPSLRKVFVLQLLLIKAGSKQVYSFVFWLELLFSEPFENETVQSIVLFLRERYTTFQIHLLLRFKIKTQTKLIKTKSAPVSFAHLIKSAFVQSQTSFFFGQLILRDNFSNQVFCF